MAEDPDNHEARVDRMDLALLEEDPSRLDIEHTLGTVTVLTPEDLDLLTPARLRLLNFLATSDEALNVTQLADAVGRDKKNVSEDLSILEDLGLVAMVRKGREKFPRRRGTEIRIELGADPGAD